jgi:hypothetical protein
MIDELLSFNSKRKNTKQVGKITPVLSTQGSQNSLKKFGVKSKND